MESKSEQKTKMTEKDKKLYSFLKKIDEKGKYGFYNIKLPYREGENDKYFGLLKQLVKKGLLSQKTYDKEFKEREARTLDDELYKEFYELLILENNVTKKNNKDINIEKINNVVLNGITKKIQEGKSNKRL